MYWTFALFVIIRVRKRCLRGHGWWVSTQRIGSAASECPLLSSRVSISSRRRSSAFPFVPYAHAWRLARESPASIPIRTAHSGAHPQPKIACSSSLVLLPCPPPARSRTATGACARLSPFSRERTTARGRRVVSYILWCLARQSLSSARPSRQACHPLC